MYVALCTIEHPSVVPGFFRIRTLTEAERDGDMLRRLGMGEMKVLGTWLDRTIIGDGASWAQRALSARTGVDEDWAHCNPVLAAQVLNDIFGEPTMLHPSLANPKP